VLTTSTSYPLVSSKPSVGDMPTSQALAMALGKLQLGPKNVLRKVRHNQVSQGALTSTPVQDLEVKQEKPVEARSSPKVFCASPRKSDVVQSPRPAPLLRVNTHALLEQPAGISSLPKVTVPVSSNAKVLEAHKRPSPGANAQVDQVLSVHVPLPPEVAVQPPFKHQVLAASTRAAFQEVDQEQPVHFVLPSKAADPSPSEACIGKAPTPAPPRQMSAVVDQEKSVKVPLTLTAKIPPVILLPLPKTKPRQKERSSPSNDQPSTQRPLSALHGGTRANSGLPVTIQRSRSTYQVARHNKENWNPRNTDLEQGPADLAYATPPALSLTKSVLNTLRGWISPAWWGSR
jgi:hypothetical protein